MKDNQVSNRFPVQNTFNAELWSVSHVLASKHKFEIVVFIVAASAIINIGLHWKLILEFFSQISFSLVYCKSLILHKKS